MFENFVGGKGVITNAHTHPKESQIRLSKHNIEYRVAYSVNYPSNIDQGLSRNFYKLPVANLPLIRLTQRKPII